MHRVASALPIWCKVSPLDDISNADAATEREADRIAGQAVGRPTESVRQIAAARPHAEYDPNDQYAPEKSGGLRIMPTSGSPLPGSTRQFFEEILGYDFSAVRVHDDTRAAHSAAAIGARAYTLGSDIAFAENQYDVASEPGLQLLAHELVHTIQGGAALPRTALGERVSQGAASHTVHERAPAGVAHRQLSPPIPIMVVPARSLEVSVVDARQETSSAWYNPARYTGPLAYAFRGDLTMTSVATMVDNVLTFLHGRSMARLNIMDHGNAHGIEIGDDWLAGPADVARFAGALGRLRPRFTSGGFVHMQNCEAGQNRALICALAKAFGVPVYAGTGVHNPVYGFNLGDYVSCAPGGAWNPDAGRPSTPAPPSELIA